MHVSSPRYLVRDVLHFEQVRLRAEVGYERATTGDALYVTLDVQLP